MRDAAVIKLQKQYHAKYDEYINWPLTRKIALGDIGQWSSGKTFSYQENVSKYGITLPPRGGGGGGARAFTSVAGVDMKFKAAGNVPLANTSLLKAKAGVSLALNANSSCVLRTSNVREETVPDKSDLEEALKRLNKDPSWWKHRIVVTSIVKADVATIALASSSKQRVDINATVATSIPFDLVDAGLGLQIGYQSENTSVDLLVRDVVLAFQYSKLSKGKWWHSWAKSTVSLTT